MARDENSILVLVCFVALGLWNEQIKYVIVMIDLQFALSFIYTDIHLFYSHLNTLKIALI